MESFQYSWQPLALTQQIPELDWYSWGAAPSLLTALKEYRDFYNLPDLERSQWREHRIGYEHFAEYEISVQQWLHKAPRANLIVVHGYYDHIGLYGSVIRFCERHHFNLLAFDLPGHGLSGGPRAEIGSFDEYTKIFDGLFSQAAAQWPGPWYALGQSTGGAILSTWLLAHRPVPAQDGPVSVALLAPLLKPQGWNIGRWLAPAIAPFRQRLRRRFRHDGNTPDFSYFLEQHDPLQPHYLSVRWVLALSQWISELEAKAPLEYPVFLVQGDQDKTVAWQYNLSAYQKLFPNLMTHLIPGAHHHLVNDQGDYQDTMYQWLGNHFVIE